MQSAGGKCDGGGCTSIPDWVDAAGNNCQYYMDNGCANSNSLANAITGKTANEACCCCGGGSISGPVFVEFRNAESNMCLDLRYASTRNGNWIRLSPCNGGASQKWWVDSNSYIRSSVDNSKCIVGNGGRTSPGTNLMIWDCFTADIFAYTYSAQDKTFRPKTSNTQCMSPSPNEIFVEGVPVAELSTCNSPVSANQQWVASKGAPNRRQLEGDDRTLQNECVDAPLGWFDSFGDNCDWYAEGFNCEDFGSLDLSFGKTANQACCACGGGSALEAPDMEPTFDFDPPPNTGCYDSTAGWRDSVGDDCVWYAQGDNCAFYGDQFAGEFGTANQACCACGGGSSVPPPPEPQMVPGCTDSPPRTYPRVIWKS